MNDEITPKTLGERIRFARERANMTQQQLEASSGVSQQAISMLENGVTKRTVNGEKLAGALGVRSEWLVTGVGKMYAERPLRGEEVYTEQVLSIAKRLAELDPVKLDAVSIVLGLSPPEDALASIALFRDGGPSAVSVFVQAPASNLIPLFDDDFETGDTGAWSAVSP